MQKILEKYLQNKKEVQIIIREKQMEGTVEAIEDGFVYLIGEKYEYHVPIDKIVTIGCKLDKKERKQKKDKNPPLGFKLAVPLETTNDD
jgi:hypothetical protein